MLKPRIIPCLLVRNGGLVKTIKFGSQKYVGDPLNAVRIFNEKEVDELMVLDIDATIDGREPNYALINDLATECRMPLAYGGGVSAPEQAEKIISLGVEKVILGASAVSSPELISRSAERVGSQSISVVIDVKKSGILRKQEVFTHSGTRGTGFCPDEFAVQAVDMGAGEIVLNSVDLDGTRHGYDIGLIRRVRNLISVPMTVLGGAGSLVDIERVISEFGPMGIAAGSLFVFKGPYRAVLINYPSRAEKDEMVRRAMGRVLTGSYPQ